MTFSIIQHHTSRRILPMMIEVQQYGKSYLCGCSLKCICFLYCSCIMSVFYIHILQISLNSFQCLPLTYQNLMSDLLFWPIQCWVADKFHETQGRGLVITHRPHQKLDGGSRSTLLKFCPFCSFGLVSQIMIQYSSSSPQVTTTMGPEFLLGKAVVKWVASHFRAFFCHGYKVNHCSC